MFVQPEDFWRMLREVERKIAWEKGEEHGSFNYTGLLVLSENGIMLKTMKALMLELSKVIHLKIKRLRYHENELISQNVLHFMYIAVIFQQS